MSYAAALAFDDWTATQPHLLAQARWHRDVSWSGHPLIPPWVNLNDVGLDRFFTRLDVAEQCWEWMQDEMRADYADPDVYWYVDPSAGDGVFYDLLPEGRRSGVEIVPGRAEFDCTDYLSWLPPSSQPSNRIAVIGNPPFGYRAWLALAFVNHSAVFADYIGMILPMAFQSDGKGSPKYRVHGAQLIRQEHLPVGSFCDDYGQPVQVNALWQIWRRGVNNRPPNSTCDQWVDLFTVDMRKERLCGQEKLAVADWFLQRTFYSEPPQLVRDFSEVRYVCGYGIIIKQDADDVTRCLSNIDWCDYSNLAAHNCRHISMYHIRQALIDSGFVDD
ncbi:MAG: hypothetical protein F4X48_05515 [Acidimicrobiia bacterium]|nr:hypothetical protein [Acidimicrobiia bacterium]MYC58019.1 hypothetical protein [Acidimicrobiia bacterium]MYI30808.1 hypothetical protein [Acidimicrobiia bacterium]